VGVAERSCSGLHVSKRLDKSSPILSAAAIAGSIYPNMTVSIVNATQSPGAEFLTYTLANVAVKAINQGGSTGGGTFSEQISLSPDTITIAYRPQKADGSLDAAIQFSINCPKSK
jgi:type VI secretion system secreted protein Hcp